MMRLATTTTACALLVVLLHLVPDGVSSFATVSTTRTKCTSSCVSSSLSFRPIRQQHHSPIRSKSSGATTTAGASGPLYSTTTSAAAAAVASALSSPVGALGILAVIVLIHESGHYLAAKGLFGMQVEEFSVGVGPRVAGFELFGNEFNLRALPLGGYVRFPENYNATAVSQQEMAAMERIDAVVGKKLDERGPAARLLNVLTLGAVGNQEILKENLRRIEAKAEENSKPWWKKPFGGSNSNKQRNKNDNDNDDDLEPLVKPDDIEIDYYDDPQLLQNRPWLQRAIVLSGGVVFNFLLAFGIYLAIIFGGAGLPTPVYAPGALVSATPESNAAASGLLYQGDVVIGINGQPLTTTTATSIKMSESQPTASQAKQGIDNFIQQIRATPAGDSIDLTVLRAMTTTTTKDAPTTTTTSDAAIPNEKQQQAQKQQQQQPVHVTVVPKTNAATGTQSIGVLLQPNYSEQKLLQSRNLPQAVGMAAQYSTEMISDTASGLASALQTLIFGSNTNSGAQLSGPIGLIRTGSAVVATQDVRSVLLFAAALSINLGVVNAFPIPALDGGQLVFVLAEAVTGRKVNQRVQESITGATLFFLLLVSASAAVGDVQSLFGGGR